MTWDKSKQAHAVEVAAVQPPGPPLRGVWQNEESTITDTWGIFTYPRLSCPNSQAPTN